MAEKSRQEIIEELLKAENTAYREYSKTDDFVAYVTTIQKALTDCRTALVEIGRMNA